MVTLFSTKFPEEYDNNSGEGDDPWVVHSKVSGLRGRRSIF